MSQTETAAQEKKRLKLEKENGEATGEEKIIGKHIEIPESNEYFMDLKRKQNNDKMFLNLQVKGPKDSKDFKINLTYPDYDIPVPILIRLTRAALERFESNYAIAQEIALQQTPKLEDFFLV